MSLSTYLTVKILATFFKLICKIWIPPAKFSYIGMQLIQGSHNNAAARFNELDRLVRGFTRF